MVWIVKTEDGKTYEVKNEFIGMFTQKNRVIKCQLKK